MKCYRIRNWDEDKENSETRKYVDLLWFRQKVKLLGEGLGHTLAQNQPDGRQGPFLYGMFKLLEQVAAGGRIGQRGWLFRNGTPLTAPRIAGLLRQPVEHVELALKFFSTPPMDWLSIEELPGDFPGFPPPAGRPPGDSPGYLPPTTTKAHPAGRPPGEFQHPENNQPTSVQQPTTQNKKKKENGRFASPESAAQAQRQQFAAAQARKSELEAMHEDDRTPGEDAELKKMRALIRAIQKKQAASDFTPVEEGQ